MMPVLSQIRDAAAVGRALCDVSPDGLPILGEPDGCLVFIWFCGFVGHTAS